MPGVALACTVRAIAAPAVGAIGDAATRDLTVPAFGRRVGRVLLLTLRARWRVWKPLAVGPARVCLVDGIAGKGRYKAHMGRNRGGGSGDEEGSAYHAGPSRPQAQQGPQPEAKRAALRKSARRILHINMYLHVPPVGT